MRPIHNHGLIVIVICIDTLIHRTICHRLSAATLIGRPIRLLRRQQYVLSEQCVIAEGQQLTDQYIAAREHQYVLPEQYVNAEGE